MGFKATWASTTTIKPIYKLTQDISRSLSIAKASETYFFALIFLGMNPQHLI